MKRLKAAAWAWTILILAPPLWALSIRSPGKKIVIDELKIGRSYSLAKKARDPAISNTGNEPIKVRLWLTKPTPPELEDGYESPPPGLWIRLKETKIGLSPGKTKDLNGIIVIPDKPGLKEGQYQIDWIGEADNRKGSRLQLTSHLLLNIDGNDTSQIPRGQTRDPSLLFILAPPEARARDVPLGKQIKLAALKLVNPNDFKAIFALRRRKQVPRKLRRQIKPGFTLAPDPYFLRLENQRIAVGAGKIGSEKLKIEIPDESRYRNRKWFFIVSVAMVRNRKFKKKNWIVYVQTTKEAKK